MDDNQDPRELPYWQQIEWYKNELVLAKSKIAQLKAQLAEAKQDSEDNYTQGQKRGMDALSESNKYRYAKFDDLPKELKDRLPRIR